VPTLPQLPDQPTVSAIMVAKDAAATIGPAVRSILSQVPAVDEVVVALGPSSDGTEDVLERLAADDGRVRVLDSPSGRIPDGLTIAIAASHGQVLVRVDAHNLLPDGYVGRAVQILRATGAANVGGRQRPLAADGFAAAVATAMASVAGSGGATYRVGAAAGEADTVFLGVFRREALEAVGGYDHRFARNEDAELNHRLRVAGYRVWFDPSLEVAYRPRDSVAALARQYFANGRWRRLTAREHPASVAPRQVLPSALVVVVAASAVGASMTRRPRYALPIVGYGAALLAAGAREADGLGQGTKVAVALGTMHLSFGLGFLVGPPRGASTSST
jgi:succinoglycan biosynthesis protein ExoA